MLDMFYPNVCAGCGNNMITGEIVICLHCHINLPRTGFHSNQYNPVKNLFRGRLPIANASSFLYFRKSGLTQTLIHQLKYKGKKEIGEHLGNIFGTELKEENYFDEVDIILPIPLHKTKLMQRGYNQSDYVAAGLGISLEKCVYPEMISRKVITSTQTKKKRYERWENVEDIFVVNEPDEIYGKHVLIVDDIITTGATLESCAKIILDNGAAEVSVLSLGFAQ
ncbi:MAG: ComF family protein [Bacteroidia bacterium]|nr:ComF family protein [Bacteroidia bacterium]